MGVAQSLSKQGLNIVTIVFELLDFYTTEMGYKTATTAPSEEEMCSASSPASSSNGNATCATNKRSRTEQQGENSDNTSGAAAAASSPTSLKHQKCQQQDEPEVDDTLVNEDQETKKMLQNLGKLIGKSSKDLLKTIRQQQQETGDNKNTKNSAKDEAREKFKRIYPSYQAEAGEVIRLQFGTLTLKQSKIELSSYSFEI